MASKIANQGLLKSYFTTLGMMLRDKAVVLMLIVAPIIYGFYYPWPYSPQIVRQSTIGIIDNDRSNLARQIIRFAEASPYLVLKRYADTRTAYQDLAQRQIEGYLIIPEGLKSDVFLGNQVIGFAVIVTALAMAKDHIIRPRIAKGHGRNIPRMCA